MSDTLEIFGTEYTDVVGIKATDSNNQTKTYIRPQGTKSITSNGTGIDVTEYASVDVSVSASLTTKSITSNGTYAASSDNVDGYSSVTVNVPSSSGGLTTVASGTFTGTNAYNLAVSVGKKMPQTDFLVYFRATKDTEFPYSSKSKFTDVYGIVFSDMAYFDLSSVGDGKQVTGTKTYKTDNSGTKTTVTFGSGAYLGEMVTLSNNSFSSARYNNFRINRKSDHFEVRMYHSNSNYAYPTGITYSWKVVYFGSNPSTDIVEIT